jgi:hypothetical protein
MKLYLRVEIRGETFLTIGQRYGHLNYASRCLDAKDVTEKGVVEALFIRRLPSW